MAPQRAWSEKRERQYQHIVETEKDRGRSTKTAKEIAARTVNKTRREHGETISGKKRTEGTGNPNVRLDERTRDELYNRARQLGIEGRSRMSKAELVNAIRHAS
ncbi:MAG: Rho termination factor N-terminal domain-containing protein [Sandaracinaceae bacterium]